MILYITIGSTERFEATKMSEKYLTVNHRIAVYTMDEVEVVKVEASTSGAKAGYVEGFKAGEKETWRALTSVAMLGTIVAITVLHFNSLI